VALFALSVSPTTAQSPSGLEPPEVPGFVRNRQAVTDSLRRVNEWIASGRGDIPTLLEAHAAALVASSEDPDIAASALGVRIAAASMDADPARVRALITEFQTWSRKYEPNRPDHKRPIVALGSLWVAVQGTRNTELALEVARATDAAFPNTRWVRRLLAHSLTLHNKHTDAAAIYAALLDSGVVSGEYGVTYKHEYEGAAISDATTVYTPLLVTSTMPFYSLLDQRSTRLDETNHSQVVVYDLPEVELWVNETAASPQRRADFANTAKGKAENGWKWLAGRVDFESSLLAGDKSGASLALNALKAIELSQGPNDSDIGPMLRWLEFRLAMQVGDRKLATELLTAVLRDAVGDGGLRPGVRSSVLTLSMRTVRNRATLAAAELVAAVPPEAMVGDAGEYEGLIGVIENSEISLIEVWNVAFPLIRARNPEWLDKALESMGRAQVLKGVKATAHSRSLGWHNGFGGMIPHGHTIEELSQMMRDAAWSWILMVGPTAHNFLTDFAHSNYDSASNTMRMLSNISVTPFAGVPLADQTPRQVMRELARQYIALASDGGLARAKEALAELDKQWASSTAPIAEGARPPRPNAVVWNSRNYSIHREILDALFDANPELAGLMAFDAKPLTDRENIPRMSSIVAVMNLTNAPEVLAKSAADMVEKLKLPPLGEDLPPTRQLLSLETVACCATLGAIDYLLAQASAEVPDELKTKIQVLAGRLENALWASSEVGAPLFDIIERELLYPDSPLPRPVLDAFMKRLCRNELAAACRKSFVRNDAEEVRNSGAQNVVAVLRDTDSEEHRGWPLKMRQWVPASDPLWARVELKIRQSLSVPVKNLVEDKPALNNLAWSTHLIRRPSADGERAAILGIAVGALGTGYRPADVTDITSTMDTLAWTTSDLGRHADAIAIQSQAMRLAFGYDVFRKGLVGMERAAAASLQPKPTDAKPADTKPTETPPAPGNGK